MCLWWHPLHWLLTFPLIYVEGVMIQSISLLLGHLLQSGASFRTQGHVWQNSRMFVWYSGTSWLAQLFSELEYLEKCILLPWAMMYWLFQRGPSHFPSSSFCRLRINIGSKYKCWRPSSPVIHYTHVYLHSVPVSQAHHTQGPKSPVMGFTMEIFWPGSSLSKWICRC